MKKDMTGVCLECMQKENSQSELKKYKTIVDELKVWLDNKHKEFNEYNTTLKEYYLLDDFKEKISQLENEK
jgi:hypothetical protein